jgi:hypothetical protein
LGSQPTFILRISKKKGFQKQNKKLCCQSVLDFLEEWKTKSQMFPKTKQKAVLPVCAGFFGRMKKIFADMTPWRNHRRKGETWELVVIFFFLSLENAPTRFA